MDDMFSSGSFFPTANQLLAVLMWYEGAVGLIGVACSVSLLYLQIHFEIQKMEGCYTWSVGSVGSGRQRKFLLYWGTLIDSDRKD